METVLIEEKLTQKVYKEVIKNKQKYFEVILLIDNKKAEIF